MSTTELVSKALYRVEHARKGTFTMWVEEIDDQWARGHVVDGIAQGKQRSSFKASGDAIVIRRSFSRFTRLDGPTEPGSVEGGD